MDPQHTTSSSPTRRMTAATWLKVVAVSIMAAVLYLSYQQHDLFPSRVERLPPFDLTTLDGDSFTDQDLEGPVTVLNFFATWCGPCNAEMPMLQRFADHHAEEGLRVVALSAGGDDRLRLRKFAARHRLTIPIVLEGEHLLEAVGVSMLPTTVVVDSTGRVAHVFVGLVTQKRLEAVVTPLLAPNTPTRSG